LPYQKYRPEKKVQQVCPVYLQQAKASGKKADAAHYDKTRAHEHPQYLQAEFSATVGTAQRVQQKLPSQPQQQDNVIVGVG
jgi:hypothetical protein